LWSFGIFCVHLVYFMVFRYIFPHLICCTTKNLATLAHKQNRLRNAQVSRTDDIT
jgi:hypothetical protein